MELLSGAVSLIISVAALVALVVAMYLQFRKRAAALRDVPDCDPLLWGKGNSARIARCIFPSWGKYIIG